MIGHWHQCLYKSEVVDAILMDLSKAFDTFDHNLILSKLAAYGLDKRSLLLLKCYLSNRHQRTKNGSFFREWLEIIMGVPQGSILAPLLFNIFINDLLYIIEKTNICNFTDDNTIYAHSPEINEVVLNLKHDLLKVLSWFSANQLVANPTKFQMLVLGSSENSIIVNVGNTTVTSSDSVKLLGTTIDKELLFRAHIENLCWKASNYVRSLYRIRNVIVGVFYRPPSKANFLEFLTNYFSKVSPEGNELYILGDFNINLLHQGINVLNKADNRTSIRLQNVPNLTKQYKEFCSAFGLSQLIQEATRTTCSTSSLIDHILTNCVSQSGVANIGLSDHQLVFCKRKSHKIRFNMHKQIKFRSFKSYSKEIVQNALQLIPFPNYENFSNINLAYSDFTL